MLSANELFLAKKSAKTLITLDTLHQAIGYSQSISLGTLISNGLLLAVVGTGYLAVPSSHLSEFSTALQLKRRGSRKSGDYHVI